MVAYVFSKLLSKGSQSGYVPGRTQASRNWFRDQAKSTTVAPSRIIRESTDVSSSDGFGPGTMTLFQYDPLTKETLPYYDRFPLVFVVEMQARGFLGINLHYLPLNYRAILMDSLYDLKNNENYNQTTKLRLSYEVLKSTSKFKYARPCFKRYIMERVRSRFVPINADQWDTALFLPLQRFTKASTQKVYRDSLRKIA